MSWARFAIERLLRAERATIRPSGHSMTGVVNHRDKVELTPIDPSRLEAGDAVLVRVSGQVYLHLVKAVDPQKSRVLIGNNCGKINGWTTFSRVYGVAIQVAGKSTRAAKRATPTSSEQPGGDS